MSLAITRSNQEPLPPPKKSPARRTIARMPRSQASWMRCSISTRMRALARGRLHRRALVEHRRHAAAVVPDAAGKQQGRAVALGRRDRRIGERQRVLPPFGDRRIERVEHHVAAAAPPRPPRRASPPRPPRSGAAPRRRGPAAPGPSPASRRRGRPRPRRSRAARRRRARGCGLSCLRFQDGMRRCFVRGRSLYRVEAGGAMVTDCRGC